MNARTAVLALVGTSLVAAAPASAIAPLPSAAACSRVVSPSGSDTAAGTLQAPWRTLARLGGGLGPGQTGCVRAGRYDAGLPITRGGAPGQPVTIRSFPGDARAVVGGQVWISRATSDVTVADLRIAGTTPQDGRPAVAINGQRATLAGNDITNGPVACVYIGHVNWGQAVGTRIVDNVIHDCGTQGTNLHHGIYVREAVDTEISGNVIARNPDRGVQLFNHAVRTTVRNNVIDANGEGVIFSGDAASVSSDNTVTGNVISNSRLRWDVESWWVAGVGTGNSAHGNCIGGGRFGPIQPGQLGFTATNNLLGTPAFDIAGPMGYALRAASPCVTVLGRRVLDPLHTLPVR